MSLKNGQSVDPEAESLLALLQERADETPPEEDQLLARHLQCKDSVRLANAIQNALARFPGNEAPRLEAPSSILPPLY